MRTACPTNGRVRRAELLYSALNLAGMPQVIEADELTDLVNSGAQLVEVLPAREYEEEHLPGALNIPLKSLDAESVAQLDRDKPIIVYCWDDK
jgi:rhodanese-related sulfurtransferase